MKVLVKPTVRFAIVPLIGQKQRHRPPAVASGEDDFELVHTSQSKCWKTLVSWPCHVHIRRWDGFGNDDRAELVFPPQSQSMRPPPSTVRATQLRTKKSLARLLVRFIVLRKKSIVLKDLSHHGHTIPLTVPRILVSGCLHMLGSAGEMHWGSHRYLHDSEKPRHATTKD